MENKKGSEHTTGYRWYLFHSNNNLIIIKEQMILKNEKSGWSFLPAKELVSPLIVQGFQLGSFLKQEEFGTIAGSFRPTFRWSNSGEIEVDISKGSVTRFDINDYQL